MNVSKLLLITVALPTASFAQAVPSPSAQTGSANAGMAMSQLVVPPNTEVVVTPNDNVTTKGTQVKEGFKFRISTMFDVMQDGIVVIPKGTPGEGTVTWLTSKGAFGKSGKMEVSFDWLELSGRRISLTGTHRQEGEGNTGATVGAVVAVGVFAGFVTGRSATIVNGQQFRARIAEPLTFNVPASAQRAVTGALISSPAAAQITPATSAILQPRPDR